MTPLEKSIEHWEQNRDAADILQVHIKGSSCALCGEQDGCEGCPVMEFTGKADCEDTPWMAAYDLKYHDGLLTIKTPDWWVKWRKACQDEIDFLESLR